MHGKLQDWLNEMNDEIVIVNSSDINKEAIGNMVAFGVSKETLATWGKESVIAFLEACRDLYKSKSCGNPMQFYSWYDEQASQLCVSAVSSLHNKLPFKCQLAKCGLIEMVTSLFSSHSGLYDKESRLNVWQSGI